MMGLWITRNAAENERELQFAFTLIQKYSSAIEGVLVGNEAIFGQGVGLTDLFNYIRRVKSLAGQFGIPVGTGERAGLGSA